MNEEWRQIPSYPEYEASSLGRIRWIRIIATTANKINGYRYARLRISRGVFKSVRAHRLILEAFKGPAPPGTEARHLNGDRSDNRVENLEWGTRFENTADRKRHGTAFSYFAGMTRDDHPFARLTSADLKKAKEMLARGMLQREVAAEFGVSQSTISRAIS